MVPPGHAAVGRLEGRLVGGGGQHRAAAAGIVEAEEDERVGRVGEGGGGGGGGGVRGRVRVVGVPEGGGTAGSTGDGDGTAGDGTIGGRATFAIRILRAAANNGGRLEAPRRPEVGQQQEGGDGEGPLHRLGWWAQRNARCFLSWRIRSASARNKLSKVRADAINGGNQKGFRFWFPPRHPVGISKLREKTATAILPVTFCMYLPCNVRCTGLWFDNFLFLSHNLQMPILSRAS